MKRLKYFIPLLAFLLIPWLHRLLIENMMLALPWVDRPTAEYWIIGVSVLTIIFSGMYAMESS